MGVARLGHRVGFVGKLGDDENGQALFRAFEQEGVDTGAIVVEAGRPTATCFISLDAQATVSSLPCRGPRSSKPWQNSTWLT